MSHASRDEAFNLIKQLEEQVGVWTITTFHGSEEPSTGMVVVAEYRQHPNDAVDYLVVTADFNGKRQEIVAQLTPSCGENCERRVGLWVVSDGTSLAIIQPPA